MQAKEARSDTVSARSPASAETDEGGAGRPSSPILTHSSVSAVGAGVLDGPAEQVPSNKRFGRIRIQPGYGFAQNSSSSSHAPRGTSGRPSPTMKQAFRCRGSYQLPVDPRSEGLSPRREADAGRGPSHRRLAEAAPDRPSATPPKGKQGHVSSCIIVFR